MFNVLSQIVRGIWAIEPSVAESYLPQIMLVLNGKSVFDNPDPKRLQAAIINPDQSLSWSDSLSNANAGSIAMITISGPMMKGDNCGDAGTATRTKQINQASENQAISAIILEIDTPGGSTEGLIQFEEAIKKAASKKPVISFVNGMMASAGYFAGSAATEIIASTKLDKIGSIGTMSRFSDMSKALEAAGVVFHEVYADRSTDKNKVFNEAIAGNYGPLKKEILNPFNDAFISTVTENRKGKFNLSQEDIFTGKLYSATDAVNNGLIDGIGNMDYAIARAKELASSTTKQTKSSINATTETMKLKSTYNNIIASLKAKFNIEATEETVMTEEYAEHLNAELGTTKGELETAQASLTQLQSDLAAAQKLASDAAAANETAKADHANQIEALNEEITELKKQPGADTTIAGKSEDVIESDGIVDPQADHVIAATKAGF